MASWRVGRTLGVTLYRDEVFVGHVSTAEIALEIVAAMRVVEKMIDPQESGRERSPACPNCPGPTVPHQHMAITRTEFDRIQDQLSRVDPYDSTKGGIAP